MDSIKSFFIKNKFHFIAIGLFLLVCSVYFNKQLQGFGLKQHDIQEHIGSSHEVAYFREQHKGEEPLWTNSMFGGMPTMQISTIYSGNLFAMINIYFFTVLAPPLGVVLLYMLCFYIAMNLIGMNKWISIFGAIAFAFLSYNIIILQAGHNSKAVAVAYMLPVVGSMLYAYRKSWKWGAIFSALAMSFEMSANHLQITYYLGFCLLFIGLVELYNALKNKNIKSYLFSSIGIIVAYGLALMVNYSNIKLTADYSKYTIRGGNDITIQPDGSSNSSIATEGLDRDYVTQYSYGIGESFTLISPYVKGGGTMALSDSPFADKTSEATINGTPLNSEQIDAALNSNAYWGNQPIVSGPVYIGVILALLAFLALIYVKDIIKWGLLATIILTLMLSWGKNYMGLTNFFLDNVPGYDKFRAVTIILVIVEMCVSILAILFLNHIITNKDEIKQNIKKFYLSVGGFVLFLVVLKVVGIENSYLSDQENSPTARIEQEKAVRNQIAQMDPNQLAQNGINPQDPNQINQIVENQLKMMDDRNQALVAVRKSIFDSSLNRSIGFALVAVVLLFLLIQGTLSVLIASIAIGTVACMDVLLVSNNYLNNTEQGTTLKYWEEALNTKFPIAPDAGDQAIMDAELAANPVLKKKVEEARNTGFAKATDLGANSTQRTRIGDAYAFAALNENTNYRVFDFSGGFSSSRASYFHKSIGGYHGAKLRNIQNLFEFHLSQSNNKVFDMMNIKYFLQPDNSNPNGGLRAIPNPTAMGNGWFVENIKQVKSANDEIRLLGNQFQMKNVGYGKLVVNGEIKNTANLFGGEKIVYLNENNDSIPIGLSNGVPVGLEVYVVRDAKGTVNTVPAQTLQADTAKSFTQLVSYKVESPVDLKKTAIIREDMLPLLKNKNFGSGKVVMENYAPNKIVYNASVQGNGLLVLSEVYYPEGWVAKVDGKETPIIRANYLLRAIEVPNGNHKIELVFELPTFGKLNTLSWITSLVILLSGAIFMFYTKRKELA